MPPATKSQMWAIVAISWVRRALHLSRELNRAAKSNCAGRPAGGGSRERAAKELGPNTPTPREASSVALELVVREGLTGLQRSESQCREITCRWASRT